MSEPSSGRVPDGTGLSSPTDPSSTVSALTGFDPSRFKPNSYDGKPRWLSKAHRRALGQFVDFIDCRLEAMNEDERAELLEACLSVSPINCGWDAYRMAEVVVWHGPWNENAAIATEAGTAETVQQGSAEGEGAGQSEAEASPRITHP